MKIQNLIKNPGFYLIPLLALTCLVFWSTFEGAFLNWDDTIYISRNPLIGDLNLENLNRLWLEEHFTSLVMFTFVIQYKITGLDVMPFHAVNLFFHLINICLAYIFIVQFTKNKGAALIVAVLFALHPLRSESVAWIMQRKDLMFAMFFMISMIFYVKSVKSPNRSLLWLLACFVAGYLAALCKIQALALAPVLMLIDFTLRKTGIRQIAGLLPLPVMQLLVPLFIPWLPFLWFILVPCILFSVTFRPSWRILSKFNFLKKNNSNTSRTLDHFVLLVNLIVILIIIVRWSYDGFIRDDYRMMIMGLAGFSFLTIGLNILKITDRARAVTLGVLFLPGFLTGILSIAGTFSFSSGTVFPVSERMMMAAYSLLYYLWRFFWPLNLTAMNPYPDMTGEGLPAPNFIYIGVTLLILFATIAAIIRFKKFRKEIIFGTVFFIINIFLVLHLIPIGGRVITADRYTYLAYLGLFYILGMLVANAVSNSRKRSLRISLTIACVILIIPMAFLTWQRNRVWKNDLVFWQDVISKAPSNHYAVFSAGLAYMDRNKPEKALDFYNRAISISNSQEEYYVNRAACLIKLGRFEDAINDLNKVLQLNPENPSAFNNRGVAFFNLFRFREAVSDYDSALKINPDYGEAKYNRVKAFECMVNYAEADSGKIYYSISRSAFFNDMGVRRAKSGAINDAMRDFIIALSYDSLNVNAIINQANAFVNMNKNREAVQGFTRAIGLQPANGAVFLYRGNSYHQLNEIKEACADWQRALQLGVKQAEVMLAAYCR